MKFNVGLSQTAIDAIEASPDLFDQTSWFSPGEECGTAHCWYGWCLALAGYDDIRTYQDNGQLRDLAPNVIGMDWDSPSFVRISDPDNTLDDLKYYHDKLAMGESIEYGKFGFNTKGFDRYGYDSDGLDNDGYGEDGYNRSGFDKSGYDESGFDDDGLNIEGYNSEGYDCDGYDDNGLDYYGRNRYGYDYDGYDDEGLDVNGCNKQQQLVAQV